MARAAADSILAQDTQDFELIVSDNSTNDQTREALLPLLGNPRLRYVRRLPPLSSWEHGWQVTSEITAEMFVLFHDDDLMRPEYLRCATERMRMDPACAGVGTYCDFICEPGVGNHPIFPPANVPAIVHDDPAHFVRCYLRGQAIVPFGSYLCRTAAARNVLPYKYQAGKYSDVCFLLDLMTQGHIVWLTRPLVTVRLHAGQDSRASDPWAMVKLCRYACTATGLHRRSPDVMAYRRAAWCEWLKLNWREALARHPRRYRRVFRIMLPYLLGNKWRALQQFLRRKPEKTPR